MLSVAMWQLYNRILFIEEYLEDQDYEIHIHPVENRLNDFDEDDSKD